MRALVDRPVFVGGCPRSGTTMVRTMLNAHPDLAVPHETRFLVDAYRLRRRWGDLSEAENRQRLAEWVVGRKRARAARLCRDLDALAERMAAAPGTLGSVLGAGFALYAERHGKSRWGDKRPSYVLNLDAVFAMFPDAQYVNVVRDPRAAVASIRRIGRQRPAGWYEDGLVAGTELWERSQRAADRWRRRLPADQFLEVAYEDVVADPEDALRRVVGFLGLDPGGLEAMVAFHEAADIKARRMHPLVRKPVTTARVRRWTRELAPVEVAFVEATLSGWMGRYGYEPVAGDLPVPPGYRRRLRRRRLRQRRKFGRRWLGERRRSLAHRHPVAARR
jgi:Sulfotransferase family